MELKPGYKQTEVGVIPEDWKVERVGDAYEICNNLRLPISRDVRKTMAGPYPYYGPTSIQDHISEYRVEGQYALIGEDGDHFLKWREQPMTLLVEGKFNVNNHAHLVKGNRNLTVWFYYWFAHRDTTSYLTRQGAGRFKLTKKALSDIPCPTPPTTEEQQAIATALGDIDSLINSLDRLIAKKRDLKQAAMQQLLTGKTRLPGYRGEWTILPLKDGVDLLSGHHVLAQHCNVEGRGVPYLTGPADFPGGVIQHTRYTDKPTTMCRKDDILVTVKGSGSGSLTMADQSYCISRQLMAIRVKVWDARFLYYALLRDVAQLQVASSGLIPGLSRPDLLKIQLRVPQPEEQRAITEVLSDMDAEIAALEARRDKTRLLKQGMMQELLTGRTRLV